MQVDGTNGNTILKPVQATLGSTRFITSGGVIKHDEDTRRRIDLTVSMPDGRLNDLLRLAMKGAPFMEGRIHLDTKISIPPLSSKVREKLLLDGRFEVTDGKFLRSKIQDQIDGLSRRGQGQPNNQEIDEVVSSMSGNFRLESERLTFRSLTFGVTGAWVNLAGSYLLDGDVLDMHGSLRLKSQGVADAERMETVGVEAGRSILLEERRGNVSQDPGRRHVAGPEVRFGPGTQGRQRVRGAGVRKEVRDRALTQFQLRTIGSGSSS